MVNQIFKWYSNLSQIVKDSIIASSSIIGFISVIISIFGVSLADWEGVVIGVKIGVVILTYILGYGFAYLALSKMYSEHIDLEINKTPITILYGDIFRRKGYKVIGCDTHFETTVDDIVVSKNSLHGKLILEHGDKSEIEKSVQNRARTLRLTSDINGLYKFPLGSIVKYDSGIDGSTYLMLAMTELNEKYESHTDSAKFEMMLVNMWKDISTVYASNAIIMPILGDGITRFDGGAKDKDELIWYMLHSLKISGVKFDSSVEIVIYRDEKNNSKKKYVSLYKYKNII